MSLGDELEKKKQVKHSKEYEIGDSWKEDG